MDSAKTVELDTGRFPVRRTPKRGLRQVDFVLERNEIRGLEQNPQTKSRWAQMARSGKKVMQFLSEGRYVANVADGKVTFYGGRAEAGRIEETSLAPSRPSASAPAVGMNGRVLEKGREHRDQRIRKAHPFCGRRRKG